MTDANDYLGYETEPQEGYMQPHKYKVRYRCNLCEKEYTRVVKSLNDPDPPCPRKACATILFEREMARRLANQRAVIEERSFPGITGDKPMVKAVDDTAKIVMEDYGLSNLNDGIRPGESMVPSLGGEQQQKAEKVFAPPKPRTRAEKQWEALGRRAIAGAYRDRAVSPQQILGTAKKPEVQVVAHHKG